MWHLNWMKKLSQNPRTISEKSRADLARLPHINIRIQFNVKLRYQTAQFRNLSTLQNRSTNGTTVAQGQYFKWQTFKMKTNLTVLLRQTRTSWAIILIRGQQPKLWLKTKRISSAKTFMSSAKSCATINLTCTKILTRFSTKLSFGCSSGTCSTTKRFRWRDSLLNWWRTRGSLSILFRSQTCKKSLLFSTMKSWTDLRERQSGKLLLLSQRILV